MVCCAVYEIFIAGVVLIAFALIYVTWNNDYWKKRGVAFIKPTPIFGNMGDRVFLRKSMFEIDQQLYQQLDGHSFGGIFESTKPVLLIREPDLIRAVLVKDFDHFVDRRSFNTDDPMLNKMMTVLESQEWKDVRSSVSPAFTSGKLKAMIELVSECGEQLANYLQDYAKTGDSLEVKSCFSRYTMDVIATTAFGLQLNTQKNPDSDFVKYAAELQNPNKLRLTLLMVMMFMPAKVTSFLQALGFSAFSKTAVRFFSDVVTNTIEHREKHGIKRPDFLQLMLDARSGSIAKDDEQLDAFEKEAVIQSTPVNAKSAMTDDVIVAQSILFFVAGYETTSILLTFVAYELAVNPDVQDRLREEIVTVLKKHDNKCSYDALQEMPYLDMCIQETLRKNPPATRVERRCTEEYPIPGSDVVVEKGNLVMVSVAGLHYDEKYFPDPHRFDPDRFSSENKANISSYFYLPFGQGPRNCIGMRFAVMEAKVALVHVLRNFRLKVSKKTEVPYVPDPKAGLLVPKNGMWLSVEKVN